MTWVSIWPEAFIGPPAPTVDPAYAGDTSAARDWPKPAGPAATIPVLPTVKVTSCALLIEPMPERDKWPVPKLEIICQVPPLDSRNGYTRFWVLMETRKWAWSPASLMALPLDPAPVNPCGGAGSGSAPAGLP